MIKVLIADDHHLVRAGIRSLLESIDDIEVVGEAQDGLEAVKMVNDLRPHVVVMDISMPILNGHEATARIRDLDLGCEVVILSMHSKKMFVHQALERGARGYLLKSSLGDELAVAIRSVSQGEVYISPAVAEVILEDYLALRQKFADANPLDALTTRERQLLQLIAEGRTNREVAQIMGIAERTVETHRSNLMTKLDAHDVPSLVKIAIKHGLISIEE